MQNKCSNCNKENIRIIPKYINGSLLVMCIDCWDNYYNIESNFY